VNRVVHFEIHVEDPRRAAEFFLNREPHQGVAGWGSFPWYYPSNITGLCRRALSPHFSRSVSVETPRTDRN